MKTLLKRLLNRSVHDPQELSADESYPFPWELLQKKKYIIPSTAATTICCPEKHFADVVWASIKKRGNVPFLICAECGVYEIDPDMLRCWNLRLETILEQVALKLEIRGGIQPLFPNLLWRLGRKKAWESIYVRRYLPKERRVLRDELSRMPKAILVTGSNAMLEEIRFDHSQLSFSLESIATLDEQCELVVDFEAFHDFLGVPPDSPQKSISNSKRGARTASIEKLVHELEEHLKAARAHAQATAEHGNMEILPRPTVEGLSQRTGISKAGVSRCLNDPDAKLLRLLWDQSLDLKMILR